MLSTPDPPRHVWEEAGSNLLLFLLLAQHGNLLGSLPATTSKLKPTCRFYIKSRQSTKSLFLKYWHNMAAAFAKFPIQLILRRFHEACQWLYFSAWKEMLQVITQHSEPQGFLSPTLLFKTHRHGNRTGLSSPFSLVFCFVFLFLSFLCLLFCITFSGKVDLPVLKILIALSSPTPKKLSSLVFCPHTHTSFRT